MKKTLDTERYTRTRELIIKLTEVTYPSTFFYMVACRLFFLSFFFFISP